METVDGGVLSTVGKLTGTFYISGKNKGVSADSEKGTGYFVFVGQRHRADLNFSLTVGWP